MSDNFPQRLRNARDLRRMSQSELADQAGFQPYAISHFETGKRSPSSENLKRLADSLCVSTDYLLGRTEDSAPSGPRFARISKLAAKLSDKDFQALEQMAAALAGRSNVD